MAFGDGSTSSTVNPSKTYAAAGTYTVSLTVTDNQGATARSSQTISVTTGGGTTMPECGGTDTRTLDRDCQRSERLPRPRATTTTCTSTCPPASAPSPLPQPAARAAAISTTVRRVGPPPATPPLLCRGRQHRVAGHPQPGRRVPLHQPLREDRLLRRHGEHALLNPM
ncbi:PKD domain-containing protein [Micromonospora sp. BRA006-A]|nr:PKD domain-containing protein [Micromonospora sp. BRA006-A]